MFDCVGAIHVIIIMTIMIIQSLVMLNKNLIG